MYLNLPGKPTCDECRAIPCGSTVREPQARYIMAGFALAGADGYFAPVGVNMTDNVICQ
jgi:hypothetical protein